jgi:predicted polyphosphate/ATP-dependent NAD kinase
MYRIGFLINPVAGMGGAVGLKGTDGNVDEARSLGAKPRSGDRAKITLELLKKNRDLQFFTCSGDMGEMALDEAGIPGYNVVFTGKRESTADDTRAAVQKFIDEGVDIILFCGGDGTARDVFSVAGRTIPLLGIPAGVKMYSGIFAITPAAAADLIAVAGAFSLRDAEILDVDEEAYRSGVLETRLFGIARVPVLAGMVQVSKQVFEEADEERAKDEIARFIREVMVPDTLYLLGAGTTTEAIARNMGIPKTLLGVDVIKNGEIVTQDANERTLSTLAENEKDIRIIISPIGAQGFIFGRGNQQISAAIVKRAGIKNIIVVATPHKLQETPELLVDTGDPELDREFGPSIQVVSGYRIAQRKRIRQMP